MTASDLVTDSKVEKPDEWPMRTAASFNPFITSGSRGWAKYYADHGDLFIRITNLKRHKIKPDLGDLQHVALPASEKEGLRTGLRQGDILISITADIGIIGYVDESVPTPAYINQHVACLRLPADQVSPKFVGYYLASSEPQRRFIEMTDVGAKTGINLTTVGKLAFPCPPLEEQEAIAEALSDADALIEGLERLIAKKRRIKQGAMQDLLTAKRRTKGRGVEFDEHGQPAGWRHVELSELATFITGPFGSTFHKSDYVRGGVPLINPSHIVSGSIIPDEGVSISTEMARRHNGFALREGDIAIGRRGEMGRCAVVTAMNAGFLCGTGSMIVRPKDKTIADLLQAILSSPTVVAEIEENSVGTTMINLNQATLASLRVLLPSDPDERIDLASVLSDMDAEIQALETRFQKARAVKEGMMQNLLTGRIRLV